MSLLRDISNYIDCTLRFIKYNEMKSCTYSVLIYFSSFLKIFTDNFLSRHVISIMVWTQPFPPPATHFLKKSGRHCTSYSGSVSWSCIVFSEGDAPLIPSLGGGRHCTSHFGSVSWSCIVFSEGDAPLIPSLSGGRHCTSHSRSVSWSCIVFSEGDAPLIPSLGGGRHCTSHSGSVFSDGDIWRVSACQSCTCRDGQIHCFYQTCPLLTCNKTMLKKGHCCPFCQGNIVSHSYFHRIQSEKNALIY